MTQREINRLFRGECIPLFEWDYESQSYIYNGEVIPNDNCQKEVEGSAQKLGDQD